MIVPKVKLKLHGVELERLHDYFKAQLQAFLMHKGNVNNETIVLAESYLKIESAYRSSQYKPCPPKGYSLSISLSIARILHSRFQQIPLDVVSQWLLNKLDQALVNMSMEERKNLDEFQFTLNRPSKNFMN